MSLDALPNVLTCLRVALVPVVFALLLEMPDDWQLGAVVFALASVSDALDGRIARARGCVSTFGTLMDPLADKLLVGAALVALVAVDRAPAWVAVVIIAREVAVSALRGRAKTTGLVIGASHLGKVKMVFQVAMILALMAVGIDSNWVEGLVYTTVGVTIASGLDYYYGYRRSMLPPHAVRAVESA
jgi:CDP-diacylglycerol--glycerol-3-phosphate 3-phosphatidyltransferase